MPPVASTTICEKPMTISMASDRPSTKRLKLDEMKPGDFEREQRAEQNEDDDQARLLAEHNGSAARRIKDRSVMAAMFLEAQRR